MYAIILILEAPLTFIGISKKKHILQARPSKSAMSECLEINFIWFVLAQIHPKTKNAMSQLLFYDIDYSGSYKYKSLLFRKLQLIKIQTIHYNVLL